MDDYDAPITLFARERLVCSRCNCGPFDAAGLPSTTRCEASASHCSGVRNSFCRGWPNWLVRTLVKRFLTAVVLIGDLSVFRVLLVRKLPVFGAGLMGKFMTVAFIRPVPLILLVVSVFYVWAYMRRSREIAHQGPKAALDAPLQVGGS